jgi:hypothetical protein
MIREPVAAGTFYPADPKTLEKMISDFFKGPTGGGAKGVAAPHAGYIYSGSVAAEAYSALPNETKRFFVFGPNHTGMGSPLAYTMESFKTPLGIVDVDEIVEKLEGSMISEDPTAHRFEHSIEVHIPFLQHLFGDFTIVPISMGMQDPITAREVGALIRGLLEKGDAIIASTDFSHYIPKEEARRRDSKAIDAIIARDPEKLYEVVGKLNISMCGYGCVAAMLYALGGEGDAKLLKYATSGDVEPMDRVVGYGAIAIF